MLPGLINFSLNSLGPCKARLFRNFVRRGSENLLLEEFPQSLLAFLVSGTLSKPIAIQRHDEGLGRNSSKLALLILKWQLFTFYEKMFTIFRIFYRIFPKFSGSAVLPPAWPFRPDWPSPEVVIRVLFFCRLLGFGARAGSAIFPKLCPVPLFQTASSEVGSP